MKVLISILLAAALILPTFSIFSSAEGEKSDTHGEYIETRTAKNELSLKTVSSLNPSSYTKIALYMNGKAIDADARLINGITYVALRFFINAVAPDMQVSYNSLKKTLNVSGQGLTLSATGGTHVVYANGRTLFNTSPSVIMSNTRLYVPILSIAKALSLSIKPGGVRIDLSGTVRPIASAESYYREDAVYWLSRIINAESRGEGLLGQIAVGNVVLNRVNSSLYPNTIWSVIFDRKYGVQFSPVLDGTIYNTPSESSILAAKICLEGYTVSERALFFLAPKYAQSSWIPNNRTYEFTIGKHDFYS